MEAVGSQVIVAILFMVAPIFGLLAYYWNNLKEIYLTQIANVEVPLEEPRQRQQIRRQRNDTTCSICLTDPKQYQISSTCGHSFCGNCLFDVHDRNPQSKIRCPLCRNEMNVVFKCYHEALPSETGNMLAQKVRTYNLAYDDNRPIGRRILEFPYILKRLFRYIMSPRFLVFFLRNVYFYRLIFMALFYLILPVDLLPQSIVGIIGYIDDLLIILIVGSYVVSLVSVQFYRQNQ